MMSKTGMGEKQDMRDISKSPKNVSTDQDMKASAETCLVKNVVSKDEAEDAAGILPEKTC